MKIQYHDETLEAPLRVENSFGAGVKISVDDDTDIILSTAEIIKCMAAGHPFKVAPVVVLCGTTVYGPFASTDDAWDWAADRPSGSYELKHLMVAT